MRFLLRLAWERTRWRATHPPVCSQAGKSVYVSFLSGRKRRSFEESPNWQRGFGEARICHPDKVGANDGTETQSVGAKDWKEPDGADFK